MFSYEKNFTIAHFDTLPKIDKKKFAMKFFFMVKNQIFSPWEGVKVGNSETFLKTIRVGRFQIPFFCVNLLNLKFRTHVINIEIISCQKFHGNFFYQSLGGCQSGQQRFFFSTTHVGRF